MTSYLKIFVFKFRKDSFKLALLIFPLIIITLLLISHLNSPQSVSTNVTFSSRNIYSIKMGPTFAPVSNDQKIAQVKGEAIVKQSVPPISNRSVYLGFWTQGLWDKNTFSLYPEKLKEVEAKINKKLAIAHYYRGWGELGKEEVLNELNTLTQSGYRPMLSANPYFFESCPKSGKNIYQTIALGECDPFIHQVGMNLKQVKGSVFLRFAWEMNLSNLEWGLIKTGATTDQFKAAWQHFHDILYSDGATNVLWVFSPNVGSTDSTKYADLYPGDKYVDWTGLDGYNWGTTQSWSKWQTFSQVFGSSYQELTKIAALKPLMLSEVNSTTIGGDRAQWYQDMLEVQIPKYFPQIKAIVFYNEDRTSLEQVNWLIDQEITSLTTLKKGLAQTLYKSAF